MFLLSPLYCLIKNNKTLKRPIKNICVQPWASKIIFTIITIQICLCHFPGFPSIPVGLSSLLSVSSYSVKFVFGGESWGMARLEKNLHI